MDEAGYGDIRVLAKGTGIALPGQVLGRVLTFGGHVVLARLLGPDGFGLFALGWTLLKVGTLAAAFGLPIGVVRLGSIEWQKNPARFRGVLLQSLASSLAAGASLGAALFLAAPWLSTNIFHHAGLVPVLRLVAPGIALASTLEVAASATRITRRMQFAILAKEVIQPGLYVILPAAAWLLGWGLPGVVLAVLATYLAALLVAVFFLARLFPELTALASGVESAFGELLRLSLPVSLAATFATMTIWVDRLIIGAFRPAADVGVYQAVSQASTLFSVILAAISLVFGPMVAHLSAEHDRARMLELFRVSTKWTLYASLPVLMVVWFAARNVVGVLYGAAYASGAQALVLLTVGQILNAATGPTGPFLNMTGHHVTWFRLSGLALMTNIILGILFVSRWGMEGAAVATSISLGGLSLASLVAARGVLGAWPYDRRFLKVGAAVLAMAAYLGAIVVLVPSGGLPRLALMAGGVLVVFAAVVWALGFDGEDRTFFQVVRQVVGSRLGRQE
ncbi:MAG TPA: oligosaccharide flippase family protein [Anaerolineales bacterium]|nr:oligosaccharide flippase family protein [Anaerolineales bacterium]